MYLKKELYELIRADESIFDFLQEGVLDGLWYWDMENPENEWMNAKFWTVLGYNPDEMPHKSSAWQGIINQDDLKVANDNFAKHCEDPNHPYDQIVRYTHKDGSTKWIRCRGLAIRDNTGKPTRMLGAHNDITEFKNAELELIKAKENAEESEAKLSALFTTMSEMVVLHELVFDENGEPVNYRIIDCNDAFTSITGITRKNAIGRLSTEVYGTKQPPFLKEYSEVALTGEPCNYETYFQPMDKHFSISVISPEKNHFATVTTDITERKRTEETLREREENLSVTLHSIGDGVITTDKFGMIDRMNPVALKLCGWHEDEIPGKPLTEVFNIIDAYTREPVPNPIEKVIENGEIVGLANHTVLVAKDGREYQIADSAAPIKDNDGNIKGIVLVFSDVSEKYAAEEERRKSDERFRIAQEMSPDGFTILHPVRDAQNRVIDFTWIYENNAIARLNGTDPQKVVGQRLLELFPGHRDTQFFKAYQQVAESGESITFEEGYAGESMQKQTWFRIVVVPMGENIAVLAQDITERKQSEEYLFKSQKVMAQAEELAALGSWEWDIKNDTWLLSDNWKRIHGVSDINLTRDQLLSLAHPEDRPAIDEAFNRTAGKGEPYDVQHRIIRQDTGEIRYVHAKGIVVFDNTGKPAALVGAAQDITERKKSEKLLYLQSKILKILAADSSITQIADGVVKSIKHLTGFDAVGIRIKKNSDYPFFASFGYSEEFLKAENSLLNRYPDGGLCRNEDGDISLECTCGLIISGKTDCGNPLFTAGGSAWTNNSRPFLEVPITDDPRLHPRNRCIHAGFLSLALIPVRAGEYILGLLHLACCKVDQLTPEIIQFYEGIGASIGEALARKQAEQALLAKMDELERFHKLTVGREITMVELKEEVNNLLKKLGEDPKYRIVE